MANAKVSLDRLMEIDGAVGCCLVDSNSGMVLAQAGGRPEHATRMTWLVTDKQDLLTAFAFGPLGLHRVWAGHRSDHRHMRPLMTATGLAPESTLRQLFHTQGTWHDVATYAAVAPEWATTAQPHEQEVLALRRP